MWQGVSRFHIRAGSGGKSEETLLLSGIWLLVNLALACGAASGQQVAVQSGLHGVNDSFFESFGTSWAVRGRHWFAQFGPPIVQPAGVGGGAQLGIAFAKGDCSGYLWLYASQGCRRSLVGASPVVVVTPGWRGWVADVSITPFVMGFIPVVGWAPVVYYPYPVEAPPWWSSPYWWGWGWPYFPHLPPRGRGSPLPGLGPKVPEVPSLPRPSDRRKAFPEHRREAFPRGAAVGPDRSGRGELDRAEPNAAAFGLVASRKTPVDGGSPEAIWSDQSANGSPGSSVVGIAPVSGTGSQLVLSSGQSSAERPALSVAELAAVRARELAAQEAEARVYWEKGQSAEKAGKLGVAKVYYQMAARRSTAEIRQLAQDRLAVLEGFASSGPSSAVEKTLASSERLR